MQGAGFILLFLGVLMVTVPLHTMSLTEYLLTLEHINLSKNIQDSVRGLLNPHLVSDVGHVLLGISTSVLVPAVCGYVGAVRENKVLLALVRHFSTVDSIMSNQQLTDYSYII